MTALKLILKIVIAPVILLLTLAIWICVGLVYVSGLVLGLLCPAGRGRPGDILPAERPYPAGDRVSHKPLWAAEIGLLAAWQGAGFEVCNTGFGLRIILNRKVQPAGLNPAGCFTALDALELPLSLQVQALVLTVAHLSIAFQFHGFH